MKKRPFRSIFIAVLSLLLVVPAFVSAQSNDYWRQQQQQMLQQQRWQQQQDDMRRQAAERERDRQRQIEIERQRQIEIERQRQAERQRQEQLRQQQIEQARRQQVEQQKRQAEEARRLPQAQQRGQQQTAEQQRQQMRIQAMLGTTRPTQVMKAPRNPTPGEIQKGFTGRVTADGRALVKFQNRVLTVPASRISGLSAKLANDNQRKSNWTAQQQGSINARVKAVTQGKWSANTRLSQSTLDANKNLRRNLPFKDAERIAEVNNTLDRIESGGPFLHKKDGAIFKNQEGKLPDGNYREYTVETLGASDRGARRIVQDVDTGRTYYTDDHYQSFVQIDPAKK